MGQICFNVLCFFPLLYSSEELFREKAFHSIMFGPSLFSVDFFFKEALFQRIYFQKLLDFSHFGYMVRREETRHRPPAAGGQHSTCVKGSQGARGGSGILVCPTTASLCAQQRSQNFPLDWDPPRVTALIRDQHQLFPSGRNDNIYLKTRLFNTSNLISSSSKKNLIRSPNFQLVFHKHINSLRSNSIFQVAIQSN